MQEPNKRPAPYILLLYMISLHVLIGTLLLKTNFFYLAGKTLGWVSPEVSSEWTLPLLSLALADAKRDRQVPSGSILLVGDSLIKQVDARQIDDNAFNFGIGGDTTRTLKARLPVLRSAEQASVVVMGIGINDLKYRQATEVLKDYVEVLDTLPNRPSLILLSLLPVNESSRVIQQLPNLRNSEIRSLNSEIKRICDSRAKCQFLDVTATFANPQNSTLRTVFDRGDGLHLSTHGSQTLGELIASAVSTKLNEQLSPR